MPRTRWKKKFYFYFCGGAFYFTSSAAWKHTLLNVNTTTCMNVTYRSHELAKIEKAVLRKKAYLDM